MESGQCSVCLRAPAKFACFCAFPPISICAACTAVHLESPDCHMPTPIKLGNAPIPAQGGNEVCDECRAKTAVKFCLCSVPFKKFCEGCDVAHYQKTPEMAHFEHSMAAYQSIASGRVSLETFRRKQLFINDFQLRIGEELARFDAFRKQVAREFDALLRKVKAKKKSALSDLKAKRAQLAAKLCQIQQTIEAKRYAESVEEETVLDDYIVNGYQLTAPPAVKMFTGLLELGGGKNLLDNAIFVELLDEWERKQELLDIPMFKGNSLRLFNRITLQMAQIVLNKIPRIDHTTAYCYTGSNTLLTVGGGWHNEAYEVNIRSGEVEKVANMTVCRGCMGIINYKESVYVIGGYTGSEYLNTGEKYGIASKSWTPLSHPMQRAKCSCSVCEHTSELYISGVELNGSAIEHFNPLTETFRLLTYDSIRYASILCCVGEELYSIRQNQMEVARLSSEPVTFTVKATFPQIGSGHYWLCCPLKAVNEELISVLSHGNGPVGLFSLKPVQGQFSQVA